MSALKPVGLEESNDSTDLAISIMYATKGVSVFRCGNSECRGLVKVKREKKEFPKFCKKCGQEFDWGRMFKTIIKECPKCNREYSQDDNYCEYDRTELEEKEIL